MPYHRVPVDQSDRLVRAIPEDPHHHDSLTDREIPQSPVHLRREEMERVGKSWDELGRVGKIWERHTIITLSYLSYLSITCIIYLRFILIALTGPHCKTVYTLCKQASQCWCLFTLYSMQHRYNQVAYTIRMASAPKHVL